MDDKDQILLEITKKIKFHDKSRNLENLARYLGVYDKKTDEQKELTKEQKQAKVNSFIKTIQEGE